jgi:hypothetical protein
MFICGKSCQSVANDGTTLERDQAKWKPVLRLAAVQLIRFCEHHLPHVDIP